MSVILLDTTLERGPTVPLPRPERPTVLRRPSSHERAPVHFAPLALPSARSSVDRAADFPRSGHAACYPLVERSVTSRASRTVCSPYARCRGFRAQVHREPGVDRSKPVPSLAFRGPVFRLRHGTHLGLMTLLFGDPDAILTVLGISLAAGLLFCGPAIVVVKIAVEHAQTDPLPTDGTAARTLEVCSQRQLTGLPVPELAGRSSTGAKRSHTLSLSVFVAGDRHCLVLVRHPHPAIGAPS